MITSVVLLRGKTLGNMNESVKSQYKSLCAERMSETEEKRSKINIINTIIRAVNISPINITQIHKLNVRSIHTVYRRYQRQPQKFQSSRVDGEDVSGRMQYITDKRVIGSIEGIPHPSPPSGETVSDWPSLETD